MSYKRLTLNLLLATFSIIVSILIVEGFLRYYKPYSALRAGTELHWMRNHPHDLSKSFTIDPNFGFRPILGNGLYNEYGTKTNTYNLQKKQNTKRLLFIGDSVTKRGKIVDALRRLFGEEKFEYWNAGVESFNTVQEVNFYKKYNMAINPDHVILTFHLNDFETTPIAFFHEDKLVVYSPNTRLENISPLLFQNSYIYRLLLGVMTANKDYGIETIVQEVQDSLMEIKTILSTNDKDFTVLIMPYLKPYEEWGPDERKNRDMIIGILKKLEITYFDLFGILNEAIYDGVKIQQNKDDFWHPSEEISILFGKYLYEKQILVP